MHRSSSGVVVALAISVIAALLLCSVLGVIAWKATHPAGTQAGGGPRVAPSASPAASPVKGGATVDTGTFSLTPGSSWQVRDRQADHVTLAASFGQIYVMSQKVDHPLTVEAAFSKVESDLKTKHPAVTSCIDPVAFAVGDLDGQLRGYDYETRTPSGEAVGVCDAIWISTDRGGHVSMFEQTATHDQFQPALEPAAAPVRASVQWKLR